MDYLNFKELYHHGIKGQKWGIRKYQNEDGSLTPEGKARYGYDESTGKMSIKGKINYQSDVKKELRKNTSKESLDLTEQYRESQSTGKSIVKTILINEASRTTYDMSRAEGAGRIKSYLKTVFDIDYAQMMGSAAGAASSIAVKKIMGSKAASKRNAVANTVGSIANRVTTDAVSRSARKRGQVTSLQQRHMVSKAMKK